MDKKVSRRARTGKSTLKYIYINESKQEPLPKLDREDGMR